jgi:hypothetical protein
MVFSRKVKEKVLESISSFTSHAVKFHTTPVITQEQIYHALVKPEHLEGLAAADRLVGPVQSHAYVLPTLKIPGAEEGKTVGLQIVFKNNNLKKLLPGYTREGFHSEADPILMAQIDAWLDRRFKIGLGFANVREVFRRLDACLAAPTQMKFYFEGITALLDMSDDTKTHANKLRETKFPGKLPSLPIELRHAALEATRFLSQMLLLPSGDPEPTDGACLFQVEDFGYHSLPWLGNPTKVN